MTDKRIIDLQEQTEVTANAYVMTDNAAVGTKKFNLKGLYDSVADAVTGADAAKTAAQAAADTATAKAELADQKATLANEKATLADQKATLANTKASLADEKATLANAKATLANEAATNANAKAQAADEAAQAADAAREAIQDDLAAKANKDGYHSLLGAGTSDALMSTDGEVDTFARRVSDHDGACRITSLRGNTVRWNQLYNPATTTNTEKGLTIVKNRTNGTVTLTGTTTDSGSVGGTSVKNVRGHKYLMDPNRQGERGDKPITNLSSQTFGATVNEQPRIVTSTSSSSSIYYTLIVPPAGAVYNGDVFKPQVFDLTEIFGAGNEPSVEEFKRRYPEDYYPYDAGSLLSVNVEGIKSVGKNLLDPSQCTPKKYVSMASGVLGESNGWTASGFIEVASGYSYVFSGITNGWSGAAGTAFYDANKTFISSVSSQTYVLTPPLDAKYMRISFQTETIDGVQVEVGTVATSYKPYHAGVTREIPPSTTFPDGILRSAGSAYDERTPTRDVKRIGSVDLGTLTWTYLSNEQRFYAVLSTASFPTSTATKPNIIMLGYEVVPFNDMQADLTNMRCTARSYNGQYVSIRNTAYTDAEAFKAALSGVMLYYELATPTVVAIDPPLNLAYPTEQGGTESIVVPTGEQSAAPTMAVVYAYDADGVRDLSQAIIAAIEGSTASTNYAIGGYFVHAGKLYKATSAIATGETINPGTNCVQTTVMAELVALTA